MLGASTRINMVFLLAPIYIVAALAYGYVLPLFSLPDDPSRVITLTEAQAVQDSLAVQPKTGVRSVPVTFPIHWRHSFENVQTVWYEFNVPGDDLGQLAPDEPFVGLMIWRVNQTADVWFNGIQIGTGGRLDVRHWNSPVYFKIPSPLVKKSNLLQIRHYAQHGWGSMEKPLIGSHQFLSRVYESRYFIQHDVALGLFVFVFVTGLFCFAVWFYGRREASYLWFAIASVGSAMYCANQFVRYPWLDADLWRWLTNIGTDLWACAIVLVILRDLGLQKPYLERATLLYLATCIPVYFVASYFDWFDLNIYFHIGSIVLVTMVSGYALQDYFRSDHTLAAFYAVVMGVGVLAGIHDTIMQAVVNNGLPGPMFEYRINLLQFVAPAGFLLIGINLLQQFIDTLKSTDRLNAELEARVEDARHELEKHFAVMQEVLVEQAAGDERERIYRDLHDDVGSKLLSLYYRLEDENNSTLAKSALEDLRDIVSHKSLSNCTLSDAVRQWRAEAFSRTQDAGIRLNWQFESEGCEQQLDESQHAQLRRMLREVLSNAILHNPQVSTITVTLAAAGGELSISVENDGVIHPSSSWQQGRGLSNLRLRARELGGQFAIQDNQGSVAIRWSVPLANSKSKS